MSENVSWDELRSKVKSLHQSSITLQQSKHHILYDQFTFDSDLNCLIFLGNKYGATPITETNVDDQHQESQPHSMNIPSHLMTLLFCELSSSSHLSSLSSLLPSHHSAIDSNMSPSSPSSAAPEQTQSYKNNFNDHQSPNTFRNLSKDANLLVPFSWVLERNHGILTMEEKLYRERKRSFTTGIQSFAYKTVQGDLSSFNNLSFSTTDESNRTLFHDALLESHAFSQDVHHSNKKPNTDYQNLMNQNESISENQTQTHEIQKRKNFELKSHHQENISKFGLCLFTLNHHLYFLIFHQNQTTPSFPKRIHLHLHGPKTDIKICPFKGNENSFMESTLFSFVHEGNIYISNLLGTKFLLTQKSTPYISHGIAEYIMQEEFGRFTGYWWAPMPLEDSEQTPFMENINTPQNHSGSDLNKHDRQNKDHQKTLQSQDKNYIYAILSMQNNQQDVIEVTLPEASLNSESVRYPRAGSTNAHSIPIVWIFQKENVSIPSTSDHSPSHIFSSTSSADSSSKEHGNHPHLHHYVCPMPRQDPSFIRHVSLEFVQTLFPWCEYLPRLGWVNHRNNIWMQLLDRNQKRTALILLKHQTLQTLDFSNVLLLHEEQTSAWINIHDHLYFISHPLDSTQKEEQQRSHLRAHHEKDQSDIPYNFPTRQNIIEFIWSSELTGSRQLYHITCELSKDETVIVNKTVRAITRSSLPVMDQPLYVDEKRRLVYYVAKFSGLFESHLYCSSFAESDTVLIDSDAFLGYSFDTFKCFLEDDVHDLISNTTKVDDQKNPYHLTQTTQLHKYRKFGTRVVADSNLGHQKSEKTSTNTLHEHNNNATQLTEKGYSHELWMDQNCQWLLVEKSNLFEPPTYSLGPIFTKLAVHDARFLGPACSFSLNIMSSSRIRICNKSYLIDALAHHNDMMHVSGSPWSRNELEENNQGIIAEPYPKTNLHLFCYLTRDGIPLNGMLYTPKGQKGPFATMVQVYGGPKSQPSVLNDYNHQQLLNVSIMASMGYAVLILDSRASCGMGLIYETAIQGRMGHIELDDVIDGILYLVNQPFQHVEYPSECYHPKTGILDTKKAVQFVLNRKVYSKSGGQECAHESHHEQQKEHVSHHCRESCQDDLMLVDVHRLCIVGWSYGGFLSLMALSKYSNLFKMAVCGAPVVCWEYYDAAYTERYLGSPKEYPQHYQKSNVLEYVPKFPNRQSSLLIIHGLLDENVHFHHTQLLIQSLQKHGKHFHLQVYSNERHGLRSVYNVEHFETLMFWLLSLHFQN